MATGLEGQLIYGAGQAAKSHQDIIGAGMDEAIKGVTEGVKEIATKAGEIHQAKLAEEEELKQEQEDLVKGYDAAWEANLTQYIEDQGLPMEAWNQAHDLAEDIKVDHDSCPTGQEGNRCRREATVKLREMAAQWTEANEVLAGAVETAGLMKSGDLEVSLYDNSTGGIEKKKILSGLSKDNITSRMKNDAEIEELTAQLSTAGPDEQMALEQEIAALEKSNQRVVGWDIPGVGFVSSKDERLSNLYTLKANDVGVAYDKGVRDKISGSWEAYKIGADDGAPFNMAVSKGNYENVINEDNIASVYYDGKITGSSEPLRDALREHPMIKGQTYDSLGITGKDLEGLDLDGNGVISEDEMTNLIDALSDPKHPNFDFKVSRDVAAGYMAFNEEKEYNKVIYGQHYYVKANGEPTTDAEQKAIRTRATTPEAGESLARFEKRGGCVSCAEELGIIWNEDNNTWSKPEASIDEIIKSQKL